MDGVLLTMMHEQNWYAGKWITAKTQKEKDYYMDHITEWNKAIEKRKQYLANSCSLNMAV